MQELNSKQSVIDTIHTKLRDSSALLGEERRRLDTLQSRARIREERRLKVSNLMRATEDEQNRYTGNLHRYGQPMSMTTPALKIGDADTSFALPALLLEGETSELLMSRQVQQDPNQRQLLASLPSAAVLRHRLAAYTTNNEALDSNVRALKRKSAELATTYRKIIGICTKTEESKVDEVIEGLLRAVESERGDVEIGRVREFLSRVEEGE